MDIADRAGVSQATVSRVLSGKPVSEAAKEAVLIAVDVLGYERPARLQRKQVGLVGLIVPELVNPVFPLYAQVIETALAKEGYTPLLCTQTPGGAHEDDYVRTLIANGAAGIIFVSGIHAITEADPGRYTALLERGLPLVFVNGYQAAVDAPFLAMDDAVAVELAVNHLVQLGHRRIGMALGPARYTPAARRAQAFRRLTAQLLPQDDVDSLVQNTHYSVEGGAAAAHALLDQGVTGIICGSDPMALGAIRAARQRNLRVSEDVSVIGSDDSVMMQFTDPPLTTVRQDVPAIGIAAVRALLDQVHGIPHPRSEYLFSPELIVRRSTGAAPAHAREPRRVQSATA